MPKLIVSIQQAGLQTSIQDEGRHAQQHWALAQGGALDDYAFRWANTLLANPLNAPVVELCGGGEQWQIRSPGYLSLTGADLGALLNGRPLSPWQVFYVKAGDQLQWRGAQHGYRAYIAVLGGWQADSYYSSSSCVLREKASGGFGGWLKSGDEIYSNDRNEHADDKCLRQAWLSPSYQPDYRMPMSIPLILNAQAHLFEPHSLHHWLAQSLKVSSTSDRMGVRLLSERPPRWSRPALLSQPTAAGAVQVTPSGEAIVLLNDRQTLGGYPKVGHVSWWGRCMLAQAQPNSRIQWQIISQQHAQRHYRQWMQFWSVQ